MKFPGERSHLKTRAVISCIKAIVFYIGALSPPMTLISTRGLLLSRLEVVGTI